MHRSINHKSLVSKSCVGGWRCVCIDVGWVNLSYNHCKRLLDVVVMYSPV